MLEVLEKCNHNNWLLRTSGYWNSETGDIVELMLHKVHIKLIHTPIIVYYLGKIIRK